MAVFGEVTHGLFTFNATPFNSMYFLSPLAVHELHGQRLLLDSRTVKAEQEIRFVDFRFFKIKFVMGCRGSIVIRLADVENFLIDNYQAAVVPCPHFETRTPIPIYQQFFYINGVASCAFQSIQTSLYIHTYTHHPLHTHTPIHIYHRRVICIYT